VTSRDLQVWCLNNCKPGYGYADCTTHGEVNKLKRERAEVYLGPQPYTLTFLVITLTWGQKKEEKAILNTSIDYACSATKADKVLHEIVPHNQYTTPVFVAGSLFHSCFKDSERS
jgi:GTP-binding protein EngB required for normal cell division